MLRFAMRSVGLVVLPLLMVSAGFAKAPDRKTKKSLRTTEETSSSSVNPGAEKDTETGDAAVSSEAATPAPQNTASRQTSPDDEYKPGPRFTPVLATSGTPGLFTVETGETLPKNGFAFSAFGNKFGRMPGSVAILQIGFNVHYAITDRLSAYAVFDAYQHAHIGCGQQLSLAPPNRGATVIPNTYYFYIQTVPTPPCTGNFASSAGTAGYVEDYPFAANDTGGLGNITLGLKYAILSQKLGNGISLSVRNDLIISTKTDLKSLLDNGTQGSPLSDLISLGVSRQWGNVLTGAFNFGFEFVRAPRDPHGNNVINLPDQLKLGAGLLFLPESRFQPMMEYTGTVFTHASAFIPDTTFGARDPLDGVWGLRMYATRFLAVDMGYRYMLNLNHANDRHGFVVKLAMAYWPEKAPPPPPNHPPTISCMTDKDMVYVDSGDTITISCNASDPDNDPLTYSWSSTGGRVDGYGPQVRWLSAGTAVGAYSITAKVDDGRGGNAGSTVNVHVGPKPYHPPTISCSTDRSSVFAGERVHITTTANSPDGLPLTYTWRANGGQIVGSGASVDLDTTGLAPGNYAVTARVDDGKGGADCSSTMEVKPVPPPPQARKIADCAFNRQLSTRIDNVCKRVLDDVALRLQNEPRATAVVIGYSDPKETAPGRRGAGPARRVGGPDRRQGGQETIAGDRATNAVKYLGEKGIDASRMSTRTGAGQAGATGNRRIDVIFIPDGATYTY